MKGMDQLAQVARRRGAWGWVFADVASATLTLTIAGRRALVSAQTGAELPAAARACQTASQRLRWALRYAQAVRWVVDADSDRHLRAGIARWSDAAAAISAATLSTKVDLAELERGLRAGEAGQDELQRWARTCPGPIGASAAPATVLRLCR